MIIACFRLCLTLLVGLITRSFDDHYARTTLKNLKKIFFKLSFVPLNGLLAPFTFLFIASVLSPEPDDWKWGVAALLFGGFTFITLLNFLVSMREYFTGLTREIRFNRPLSIL